MTAKNIERLLAQTLLHDGAMQYGLYEYELAELVDELTASLAADQDDYIFAVTENSGHVAMVLVQKTKFMKGDVTNAAPFQLVVEQS